MCALFCSHLILQSAQFTPTLFLFDDELEEYNDEFGRYEQVLRKYPVGHTWAQPTRASCILPEVLALRRFPAQQRNNSVAIADEQTQSQNIHNC